MTLSAEEVSAPVMRVAEASLESGEPLPHNQAPKVPPFMRSYHYFIQLLELRKL